MKRQAISRAISSLKDKEVTLDNIPEELAQLFDGRTFVHEQEQGLHVYYSGRTIEMACTNGLYAIVADGVHTKQPKELMPLYILCPWHVKRRCLGLSIVLDDGTKN
nr:unnamed protein product [Haemonchus contortus]